MLTACLYGQSLLYRCVESFSERPKLDTACRQCAATVTTCRQGLAAQLGSGAVSTSKQS